MKTLLRKQHILEAARRKLRENLAEYHERIDELKSVTINNELAETASQTEGRRDADIELMDTIIEKSDQMKHDLEALEKLDAAEVLQTVQFGSVVITDQRAFLVAISVEEFEVDGINVLGLSTKAPLYLAMKGMRAGDQVGVNGVTYTIKAVF